MAMAWVPSREGTWLFHCHMTVHMSPHMVIPGDTDPTAHTEHADASGGMGGLVLGVRVTGETAKPTAVPAASMHQLKLVMSERDTGWPRYKLDLQDALSTEATTVDAPTKVSPPVFGPLIVLTRGQPAEIEVVNNFQGLHRDPLARNGARKSPQRSAGDFRDSHQTTPPILPGRLSSLNLRPVAPARSCTTPTGTMKSRSRMESMARSSFWSPERSSILFVRRFSCSALAACPVRWWPHFY